MKKALRIDPRIAAEHSTRGKRRSSRSGGAYVAGRDLAADPVVALGQAIQLYDPGMKHAYTIERARQMRRSKQ